MASHIQPSSDWRSGYDSGYAKGCVDGRASGYKDGVAEGKVQARRNVITEIDIAVRAAHDKGFRSGIVWGFIAGLVLFIALGVLAT
jgi:hypothetical protein